LFLLAKFLLTDNFIIVDKLIPYLENQNPTVEAAAIKVLKKLGYDPYTLTKP
jgi:hypothetical protein